ncbi:segregation and condensation protein A [candidate division KSB1 bacterium]
MVTKGYKIKLQIFEGPIDLLWFLIKKDEINIYDIPISFILKQFLEYIELLKKLDIEVAGDFIYFASLLMSIKARLLLPILDEEDEDFEDPRMELINLLEYRKIKGVVGQIREMEENQRKVFKREYFGFIKREQEFEPDEKELNIYVLAKAYKQVIDRESTELFLEYNRLEYSLNEQIKFVLNVIKNKQKVTFLDMFDDLTNKVFVVVTFLAILELAKLRAIILNQSKPYKNLWLKKGDMFENSEEMF